MGPLATLRIVEMAGLGPAPLAAQLLADLGAEVTVIDRGFAPPDPTDVNRRGKRSIALDLKTDQGREIARRLIDRADVLIEGFRPGVMEKLGLEPDAFSSSNRGLIYARITGWGQEGPLAHTAGHDLGYLSITGALHAIGPADHPIPPLNLVADYGGGTMMLIMGILAALFERQRSGMGQVIDAAMVDGVPALMGLFQTFRARGEWSDQRGANLLDGGAPFYRCYRTSDGKFISLSAIEPQFFAVFVQIAGLPGDVLGHQYQRSRWPSLAEVIAAVIGRKTQAEWTAAFEGSDACVAPVLSFDEAAAHPHNVARGIFIDRDGTLQAAPAPRFSRTAPGAPQPIEGAGASTGPILSDLGLSERDLEKLRLEGALK